MLDKFGGWNSFGRTSNFRSGAWLFTLPQKYQLVHKREMLMWILLHYLPQGASKIFFRSLRALSGLTTLIYVHFLFEWWAQKCFIQIDFQNPTTINAFTDAQKFIIISVIPKGFGSCLASEILQHSSFSFHCAGFEGLLRTWAKLVTTSNIYLHIESPLRIPNIFPLSGDSLQLWELAAIVNVRQRSQRNPADWKVHFSH